MTRSRSRIKPATFDAAKLLGWYEAHARVLPWRVAPAARRRGMRPDPYAVWLSEIMLQQTTVATVRGYFETFVSRWPTVAALAAAQRDDVLAAWAGLGYYARARNLHACAQAVVREHGGQFPRTAAGLADLPGVGPYTAAAIAAICFDEEIAVVDGNVERVTARLLALTKPVREAKDEIRAAVQESVPARAGDFAQAMMDLGATVCTPKSPRCLVCPLNENCAARASGNPMAFPVGVPKAERPRRYGHAFVIERGDGAVWLTRRPERGLLAAMSGVPGGEWRASSAAPDFPMRAKWREAGTITHVFTHFALTLTVWHAQVGNGPEGDGWWSRRARLADEALPTLYRKVLTEAGIELRPAKRRA